MSTAVFRKSMTRVLAIMLIAALIITVAAPASFASSKSGSKYVCINQNPVKAGSYYYKYIGNGKIARSKKKDSGYKTILKKCKYGACTNGKYIYYLLDKGFSEEDWAEIQDLMRCKASGKDATKLQRMPAVPLGYYEICATYNNKIFFNAPWSESCETHLYDISKKQVRKVSDGCRIITTSGKYAFTSDTNWGIGYGSYSIRKLTSSGKFKNVKKFKKLKDLSDLDGKYVGKYLYYTGVKHYRNDSNDVVSSTIYVYRCSKKGANNKKLYTVKVDGNISVIDVGSKSCVIADYDRGTGKSSYYICTYKTGKLKKISSKPYL